MTTAPATEIPTSYRISPHATRLAGHAKMLEPSDGMGWLAEFVLPDGNAIIGEGNTAETAMLSLADCLDIWGRGA